MPVRTPDKRPHSRVKRRRETSWAQWAAAVLGAIVIVAALTATLLAGLTKLQPGWRVAHAPALTSERALQQDPARRHADDRRIIAR
jgi:hypothetical protein